MSNLLQTPDPISEDLQFTGDNHKNVSSLAVSEEKVAIGTTESDAVLGVQSPSRNFNGVSVFASDTKKMITALREGANGHGNLLLCTNTGTWVVKLSAGPVKSFINNGQPFGIGTSDPTATLEVGGEAKAIHLHVTDGSQLKFEHLPPAGKAPDQSRLASLKVDVQTGQLYYFVK